MVKLKVSYETANLIQSDRDTRIRVANGELPVKPLELLTVLFYLSNDCDIEVRKAAQVRFASLPDHILDRALCSSDTHPRILDFIYRLFPNDLSRIELILKNSSTEKKTLQRIVDNADRKTADLIINNISALKKYPDLAAEIVPDLTGSKSLNEESIADENPILINEPDSGGQQDENESVYKTILGMGISDKIKYAITGNKEARGILVKDPNKLVCGNVMKNPRITESEIVMISASRNVSAEVLRLIAKNKDWVKKYQVQLNLVTNPRVPLSISINLLKHIRKKDLALIAKSSNVPKALATMAKRMLVKQRS